MSFQLSHFVNSSEMKDGELGKSVTIALGCTIVEKDYLKIKKKVFSHLHTEYFIISYNCVKLQVTLSRQADQGPVSWKARKLFSPKGKFWSQNLLNSSTVPSSQTSQFCFVNWYFYYIIFKIIGTLILHANKTNMKQLSGPKNLSGLSRNRPQLGIRH